MKELMRNLDDVLTKLYDYEYIDIEKFYNADENTELLEVLETCISRGFPKREDMETLQELYDNLDSFIKFETNHNFNVGDF